MRLVRRACLRRHCHGMTCESTLGYKANGHAQSWTYIPCTSEAEWRAGIKRVAYGCACYCEAPFAIVAD